MVPEDDFKKLLFGLDDEAFWGFYDQRDLLLSLKNRWNELNIETRKAIEERIIGGPYRWPNEEDDQFSERSAFDILNRFHWLHDHGCVLTVDLEALTRKLRIDAPGWKPEYAKSAAQSMEMRSGWVETNKNYAPLLFAPLPTILQRAEELSGRSADFVENAPFLGLVEAKPVRALGALHYAAKNGEFPEWAWRTFLGVQARKDDSHRLIVLTAGRLLSYRDDDIASFIYSLSNWLLDVAKKLSENHEDCFYNLVTKTIGILRSNPASGRSAILSSNKNHDWASDALNSPVGNVSRALFDVYALHGLGERTSFPKRWLEQVTALLNLEGEPGCHALVIFCHQLSRFYFYAPDWTEQNLITALRSGDADERDAAWAGFLWSGRIPSPELYRLLKDDFLKLAISKSYTKKSHAEFLARLLLVGWASVDPETAVGYISDEEIRDILVKSDDEFRLHVLWQAEELAKADLPDPKIIWADEVERFLENVWPKQIVAKTPRVSAQLCNFVFSDQERFSKRVGIVLPLLSKADGERMILPELRRSENNIVDLYPEQTLAVLYAVLPDSAAMWPYDIESTIERIGKSDSRLNSDPRLVSLKRRWDAR